MLTQSEWNKVGVASECKEVTYAKIEFYGPFLQYFVVRNKEGIKINPIRTIIETPECTMNDADLLIASSADLLAEFGTYTLLLPVVGWSVEVKSEEQLKRELYDYLTRRRLI